MTMFAELGFTQARSGFTKLIDDAQRYKPTVIKARKSSEDWNIVLRGDMFKAIFRELPISSQFKINFLKDEDGSIIITANPFDIVVSGEDRDQAVDNLINDIINYSQEYINDFSLYYNSKNRRSHLPLILAVLSCNSREEVKGILGIA